MRFISVFFFVLFINVAAFAMPPTMSLDEVKPGMKGIAQTVIDPSGAIRTFNVEIVGTIDNGKGSSPYIMAKASGEVVNTTSGVLQGMSGSPVYINGKLVGALSAGFKDLDPFVFLITPIDYMTNIWSLPDYFYSNIYAVEENTETEEKNSDDTKDEDNEIDTNSDNNSDTDSVDANKSENDDKAIFICNGFDSAGINFLNSIGFKNLIPTASSEPQIIFDSDILPAQPFGVAAVMGDFLVGATGTVTAIDGNNLVGFGHSFAHGGNVNFFMTEAQVVGAVTGNAGGMKIAKVGGIIGRINQDRESGVGGILGKYPSIVPISVKVNNDTYNSIIAYNENLVPKLGAAIAYSALSKTCDSLEEATVKVSFDIKTNVVSSGTLSRQNIYYSPADVGQLAVSELMTALTLISSNTTAESNILGIDVNLNYEHKRKTASLVSATVDRKNIKPGDEITLKIKLQPYRSKEITLNVPYTVPITAREGAFVLDIHGGGLIPVTAVQPAGVILPSTKPPAEVYNEKIQNLLNANKNNELIIKPAAVVRTEAELKAEVKRMKKLSERLQKSGITPTPSKPAKFSTDYIVDNVIQCTINVDK